MESDCKNYGVEIMNLNESKAWNGDFRGVSFEIVNWRDTWWNYYLILSMQQLPDESYWLDAPSHIHDNGREYFSTRDVPILESVDNHCGWTYYARQDINNYRTIKIGCDYQHLYDENRTYQVSDILRDVKRSINSLWELVPDMKVHCAVNGEWYNVNDGVFVDGLFHSNEGQDLRETWGWSRLPAEKEGEVQP